ncbi:MAG TPA: hypothetical protein VFC02_15745, partial [Anaerolineales bacterium]|nr:hypothetical protein [Anaerolineales bacterium]
MSRGNLLRIGYPRKAGHPTLSTTARHDLIALPRSRQVFDLRYHRFKEVRDSLPEKSRGRRRAIRRATIAVMQDRPHLGASCGQAPLIVRQLRQYAVASFDGRRGALKGFDSVGRPCLPRREDLRSEPRRDGVLGKRRAHGVQCLLYRRFPSAATGARPLGGPIDPGEAALVPPLLP